jgi:ubiquitin C-terminal hydrolase
LPMLLIMKTDTSLSVPHPDHAYVQLQQQIHEALRREHPEWVDPDGRCPTCEVYESRLAKLLGVSSLPEDRAAA